MQQKGNVRLWMAVMLVALVLVLGYSFAKKSQAPENGSNTPKAGWQEYEGQDFSFEYPEKLSLAKESTSVTLLHSVAEKIPNMCDFRGDGPEYLDKLVDMSVSMMLINKNLEGAIDEHQDSSYITTEFFENNKLKNEEDGYYEGGYIMPVSLGSLNGYQITQGAEGCGKRIFFYNTFFS